jgi:hypothetical protein
VAKDSTQVVLLWRYCQELANRVGKTFEGLRPVALLLLLQLLTAAATAATEMQKQAALAAIAAAAAAAADSDSDGSSSSDGSSVGTSSRSRRGHRRSGSSSSYGVISGPRSALGDISAASDSSDDELHAPAESSLQNSGWGSGTWADNQLPGLELMTGQNTGHLRRGSKREPLVVAVSDEAIQAQAWLPHLLHGLLHYASNTGKQVRRGATARGEIYIRRLHRLRLRAVCLLSDNVRARQLVTA